MSDRHFEMALKLIIAMLLGFIIAALCNAMAATTQIVIPRECLTEVKLGDQTTCSGPDMQHLTCYRIIVTYKKGCEHVDVLQEDK